MTPLPTEARSEAADQLARLVEPPKGVAAVAIVHADGEIVTSTTAKNDSGLFEIGSLTKTLTATLLATLVVDGTLTLDATVGELIGDDAGRASAITMRELATHTSGLPRLPPNAMSMPFWPRDPYRFYDRRKLIAGLATVELSEPGSFAYSNLGFDLLGACLAAAAGAPFNEALTARVLRPAGMATARCQPCGRRGLVRGHAGKFILGARRWHEGLSGAGGVDASIDDVAHWARANLIPESTPLDAAVRLAHAEHASTGDGAIGLGWMHGRRAHWHNGGTGCFQSMVAIAPSRLAVAVVASHGPGGSYTPDDGVRSWLDEHLVGDGDPSS